MTYRHFKHEGWLYALAFLLALGLRLIQLGAMPLTDVEAAPALQALHIAQGLKPALSPHPFYILSTSILFFFTAAGLISSPDFIPALIGSLLVFAPLLFAERIKPRPGLILAFFIALDPAWSPYPVRPRVPYLQLHSLLFAWGLFNKNKANLAGIFAALALLSGPSIWVGMLGLGITWAIFQGLQFRQLQTSPELEPSTLINLQFHTFILHTFILHLLHHHLHHRRHTLLHRPQWTKRRAGIHPRIHKPWLSLPMFPQAGFSFHCLSISPLAFLLALIAIIRGWRNGSRRIIPLSIWFLVSLLLAVFLPSRQISDLAWALIPLCAWPPWNSRAMSICSPKNETKLLALFF